MLIFPPVRTMVLSILPCLIPPYALRLNRVFGTRRVGWVLFSVFSLLAAMQVIRAWTPNGLGLDPALTLDLVNFLVPVLLFIGMFHIEMVFKERLRIEQQEKQLRADLELQVQERTAALDQANEGLQREISLRSQGEQELKKSKEQYRFLFDENPQPMWIYDLESLCLLAFNTAALRHYGFTRAEFRELTAPHLCCPDAADAFMADSAKTGPGVQRRGIWRHCKKDGSVLEMEIATIDLFYAERPARLVLANDVTAQRQLHSQLLQSQKMQLTNQVAGGVADRFSRLVAGIEMDAAALSQENLDPITTERLKRIAATAASASGLTRQLLALVGRHPMEPRLFDLNRVVENQLASFSRQLDSKITLEKAYWENLPSVAGDPALVGQILQHLLANAREAMPTGGTLTVSTAPVLVDEAQASRNEGARPGSFVCLGVSDTGWGMTPEVRARLFEPFFTTKETGEAAGLGLASVQGLVKQHGGWLDVNSQPNVGTRVTVFFPSGPAAAPKSTSIATIEQLVPVEA